MANLGSFWIIQPTEEMFWDASDQPLYLEDDARKIALLASDDKREGVSEWEAVRLLDIVDFYANSRSPFARLDDEVSPDG
jgi:hypothetical protein